MCDEWDVIPSLSQQMADCESDFVDALLQDTREIKNKPTSLFTDDGDAVSELSLDEEPF